ncbi:unnamed protein product [Dovyalis caffra]|uniref:HTH myb-type domain-containing protein n=1 Tax=Dovyalis caffra TaxID=77055 RepID=A0AAV1QXC6_9ROSI|nr:unnamed protein product [Dovyalis caffra]
MHQDHNFPTRSLTQSPHATAATRWTRGEDKIFEQALLVFPEESPDRWQSIGNYVGKSAWEVKEHYDILIHDVCEIDSGRIELPSYRDDEAVNWDAGGGGGMVAAAPAGQISFGGKPKQEAERKKGTPWTEEEHNYYGNMRFKGYCYCGVERNFCMEKGMVGKGNPRERSYKFGKGDWRSISRNVVITRTPTQVASHAQKYFLRQTSAKRERKRASIHDITSVDNRAVAQPADDNWTTPPGPPTDQCRPPGSVMKFPEPEPDNRFPAGFMDGFQ